MKTYPDFRALIDTYMADLDVMRAILEAYNQMLDDVERELDADDPDSLSAIEAPELQEQPAA